MQVRRIFASVPPATSDTQPNLLPSRRLVLAGLGAAGLSPALLGAGRARAAGPQVVMANWGGDAQRAFAATFVPHYDKVTGGKMILDGAGPSNGKIRAMVESGNVTWDICDGGAAAIGELGIKLGLLEPIDYSVVDRSKVIPEFVFDYGVGNYFFSFVMAWNTESIRRGRRRRTSSTSPSIRGDGWCARIRSRCWSSR